MANFAVVSKESLAQSVEAIIGCGVDDSQKWMLDEWMTHSTVAAEIGNQLQGRYTDAEIEQFLISAFTEMKVWLSDPDVGAKFENVTLCMVVRTKNQSAFWRVTLMAISCGLYHFFHAKDDLTFLVLTKDGTVFTHKRLRNFADAATMWSVFLIVAVFLVVGAIPFMLTFIFTISPAPLSGVGRALELILDSAETAAYRESIREGAYAFYGVLAVALLMFCAWLYVNRQRGFGSMSRREFQQSQLAATQYVLEDRSRLFSCCVRRRRGRFRLFFGKYPSQKDLEDGVSADGPGSSSVVPIRPTVSEPKDSVMPEEEQAMSAQGRAETTTCSGFCIKSASYLAFLMVFLSSASQAFAFLSYFAEIHTMHLAHRVCISISQDVSASGWTLGSDVNSSAVQVCGTQGCKDKFFSLHGPGEEPEFCKYVHWEASSVCDSEVGMGLYPSMEGTCCTSCLRGSVITFLGIDKPTKWFETLNNITTFLILSVGLAAALVKSRQKSMSDNDGSWLDIPLVEDIANPDGNAFDIHEEIGSSLVGDLMHDNNFSKQAAVFSRISKKDTIEIKQGDDLILDPDANNWSSFLDKNSLIQASSTFNHAIHLPLRCLGMNPNEHVMMAWLETSSLSARAIRFYIVASCICGFLTAVRPKSLGGPDDCTSNQRCDSECTLHLITCVSARILKGVVVFVSCCAGILLIRHVMVLRQQQSVVIVTDRRVFSVVLKPDIMCSWFSRIPLVCARHIRVDSFRHGGKVWYGNVVHFKANLFERMSPYAEDFSRIGHIVIQSNWGSVVISRSTGDAYEVFSMFNEQLSENPPTWNLELAPIEDPMNEMEFDEDDMEECGSSSMAVYGVQTGSLRWGSCMPNGCRQIAWTSERDADFELRKHAMLFEDERPVFLWSFLDRGFLMDPHHVFHDVLVTNKRLRLGSQKRNKHFDCRTYCCWNVFRCGMWQACFGERLESTDAFLNFSRLSSFTSTMSVRPPYLPITVPCYDSLCGLITSIVTCRRHLLSSSIRSCCNCCSETPPKTELTMQWMRYFDRRVHADLVKTVRPYNIDVMEGNCELEAVRQLRTLMDFASSQEYMCKRRSVRPDRLPWTTAFEGTWKSVKSLDQGAEFHDGVCTMLANSKKYKVEVLSNGRLAMSINHTTRHAHLSNNLLYWDDGDVWARGQDVKGAVDAGRNSVFDTRQMALITNNIQKNNASHWCCDQSSSSGSSFVSVASSAEVNNVEQDVKPQT